MLFYYEDELKYYKVHLKLILDKEDWWYYVYHHISVLFLQLFFIKTTSHTHMKILLFVYLCYDIYPLYTMMIASLSEY